MSEKQKGTDGDMNKSAELAWQEWHERAGFDVGDDDDYIPAMPPMWRAAFIYGATCATAQMGGE